MIRFVLAFCCVLMLLDGAYAQASDAESTQDTLKNYLFTAARSGDTAMLKEFIEAGFDLNTADSKGYTALILAAYNGHLPAVEQLLEAGADPCVQDKRGNTALLGAIFKGEVKIAKRLLDSDCSPDQRNYAGQTPAMYAALFQRAEILNALSEKGADMNAVDAKGNRVESLLKGEFAP